MGAMPSSRERDPGELGRFLRARRERVSPADVGLPAGGRRRTPGLRREELAMLAGISVDYLVRLEQGRDQSPSGSVLASLSDVLGLTDDERFHFAKLVQRSRGEMCPYSEAGDEPLSPTVQAMVERLHPMPAFVLSVRGDVLLWNDAYERLMRPTGLLDDEPPNVLRYTFLDPRARTVFAEWESLAAEQVSNLRTSTVRCTDEAGQALVGELSVRSPDFARLWARHDVSEKRSGTKRLVHPVVGAVNVDFEALALSGDNDRRLVTYVPADAVTAARLEALLSDPAPAASSPARLRVVGER
jgi:transcriptional regulator with XRE-family HTH domain